MARRNIIEVPSYIKNRVDARLDSLMAVAEKHYNRQYYRPTIGYNLTGSTAGIARSFILTGKSQIDLNSVLLMENTDDFIENTVRHELAHCIDVYNNGITYSRGGNRRVAHGYPWQSVMRVLGDRNPERCHSYDTARAIGGDKKPYIYVCPVCMTNIPVSRIVHVRMQSQGQRRIHSKCRTSGQPIIFSHEMP